MLAAVAWGQEMGVALGSGYCGAEGGVVAGRGSGRLVQSLAIGLGGWGGQPTRPVEGLVPSSMRTPHRSHLLGSRQESLNFDLEAWKSYTRSQWATVILCPPQGSCSGQSID